MGMSYDSNIVLAIKAGVLPMFYCCQDDDDDADDEITGAGSGSNKANVYWTKLFSPRSLHFSYARGVKTLLL
jgi:hypothetical protein